MIEDEVNETLDLGEDWKRASPIHWVYCPKGVPVGHLELQESRDYWLLGLVLVYPEFRRQGHGTALMKAVTSIDSKPVRLIVDAQKGGMTNRQLRSWYKRFGFKPQGPCARLLPMVYTPEGF
jgi:GNAT superfamily N-acetyltransferase